MTREKFNLLLSCMIMTALVGLILLFFSPSLGTAMSDVWLTNRGGAATDVYHMVTKSYINNFQIIGTIFFTLSLIVSIGGAFLTVGKQAE